jgi:hypothetical protein
VNNSGSSVAFVLLIFIGLPLALVTGIIGASTEDSREKDRTILYCINSPEQCKIEYTYLKLKEKQK